jgi:DNA-binding transcriptional MocR family regulator
MAHSISFKSPRYRQIAHKLEALIHSGTLRPGARMPSVRRACAQHGVSLTTALQAYAELENRGLIEARPRSGFYVRAHFREPARETPARLVAAAVGISALQSRLFDAARMPEIVPLGAAYPGADNLPVVKLNRMMASVARAAGPHGISYEMPPGSERLRMEIAKRSLDRGLQLSPGEIIVTCGGTEALALCLRAVTKPGDVVAAESPTYFGILQMIEELRLKAVPIPMDAREGMDLDCLQRSLKRHRLAACLSVPNFSNPLGSLMPAANKERLVEMLAEKRVPLIEDDVNGGLFHGGIRPHVAKSFDHRGNVLLCGSFSKTLAPGYRVGWVVPGQHYERVKALKLTNTLATASLPQLAIAEFMANGGYDHHLRALRANFVQQIGRMSEAIAREFPRETRVNQPQGGFVLWVELPQRVSALKVHELALAQKVSVAPGPMFSATQCFENFLRINCGHRWSKSIERAVGVVGGIVKKLM